MHQLESQGGPKLQQSDAVQLSAPWEPLKTPRTSHQYGINGFKGAINCDPNVLS